MDRTAQTGTIQTFPQISILTDFPSKPTITPRSPFPMFGLAVFRITVAVFPTVMFLLISLSFSFPSRSHSRQEDNPTSRLLCPQKCVGIFGRDSNGLDRPQALRARRPGGPRPLPMRPARAPVARMAASVHGTEPFAGPARGLRWQRDAIGPPPRLRGRPERRDVARGAEGHASGTVRMSAPVSTGVMLRRVRPAE